MQAPEPQRLHGLDEEGTGAVGGLMPINTNQTRTVFISYAREDEHLILPVAHLLRAAGAVVFFDQEDIPYGEQWESVVLEQLRASERILVFWSVNAANSEWVRRECLIAIEAGLRVIPVPLDATPLSAELATFQALTALVPLVYQVRRSLAPQRFWGTAWRPGHWMGSATLAGLLLVSIISVMMLVRSSPAEAESHEATPLLEAVILFLGLLALIMSISLLSLHRLPLSMPRGEQNLQAEIHTVVFGQNANGDDT